jgi:hypothetical protein
MKLLKRNVVVAAVVCAALLLMAAATQIDLTQQVRGILPVGNGGTGLSSAGTSGFAPVSNGSAFVATDIATQVELDAHTTSLTAHQFLGDFTIAGRPAAAAGNSGKWVVITDASTAGNCTTGGGSAIALCRSNASSWVALGDGTSAGTTINFADSETPTGTINGTNATFTLVNSPTSTSLHLYRNGQRLTAGASADYQITGNTITFNAGTKPQTGDVLLADYRF